MCTLAIDGRDLAQDRNAARQPVDVCHGEVDFALVGGGQQMQHRVGRSAHGDVQRHRVLERREVGDARAAARCRRPARSSGGRDRRSRRPASRNRRLRSAWVASIDAVAGQREAQRLGQAVHRVCGEHARARAAGRAGGALDDLHVLVGHLVVGGGDHGVDQVERLVCRCQTHLAGLHRAAGDEHRRNIQAQRRHQHAGRDLVAVRDADHGVGAVRVDHVFDASRRSARARAGCRACRRGPSRCRHRRRWC